MSWLTALGVAAIACCDEALGTTAAPRRGFTGAAATVSCDCCHKGLDALAPTVRAASHEPLALLAGRICTLEAVERRELVEEERPPLTMHFEFVVVVAIGSAEARAVCAHTDG